MKYILAACLGLCLYCPNPSIQAQNSSNEIGLEGIRKIIEQNNSVVIGRISQHIAEENIKQSHADYLPDVQINSDAYAQNTIPIGKESSSNNLLYHFNLNSEFEIYSGGLRSCTTKLMKNEKAMSDIQLKEVQQQVTLEAFILLYDIYRNIKYKEFVLSSIHLREMEYKRIEQLYKNGVVLKSDLLRSNLYITDLQKDEVAINNSITILSEKLNMLLHIGISGQICPILETDLQYSIGTDFDNLLDYALHNSPTLQLQRTSKEYQNLSLQKLYTERRPTIKLYGQYGIGSPLPSYDYRHKLGGEIGAKFCVPISAFYKSNHNLKAQQQRIVKAETLINQQEDQLHNTLFLIYTRYQESLINIKRAKEKIELAKESARILHNSYFNQQALLIDVLESETKSMEASFEWVEAVVDSQKYYWTLRQLSGDILSE